MKNTFKFLIAGVMLAFGTSVAAATVATAPIFEFDGAGSVGSGLVENVDGSVTGTDINIDTIFVTSAAGVRTGYDVDAGYLNFDTATDTLSIVGSVDSIFGTGYNSINIFGGSVAGTFDNSSGFNVFTGTGSGGVNADILTTLGIDNGVYDYFAFTLGVDGFGVITTDITATLNGSKGLDQPPAVPVPAAVWLFGSGLLGLVGVARRKV